MRSSAPGLSTAWEGPTRRCLRCGRPPSWTPRMRSSAPACTGSGPTGWRGSGSGSGGSRGRAGARGRQGRQGRWGRRRQREALNRDARRGPPPSSTRRRPGGTTRPRQGRGTAAARPARGASSAPGLSTAWEGPTRPLPRSRRPPSWTPRMRSSAPACTGSGPTGWRGSGSGSGSGSGGSRGRAGARGRRGRRQREALNRDARRGPPPSSTRRRPGGTTRPRQGRGTAAARPARGASSAPGLSTAWEGPTRPLPRSRRPPSWTPRMRSSAPACTGSGPTGWRQPGACFQKRQKECTEKPLGNTRPPCRAVQGGRRACTRPPQYAWRPAGTGRPPQSLSRPATGTGMQGPAPEEAAASEPHASSGAAYAQAGWPPAAILRAPANASKGRSRRIRGGAESAPDCAPGGAPQSAKGAGTQRRRGALRPPCPSTAAMRMRGSGWPMRSSSWAGTARRSRSTGRRGTARGGTMRPRPQGPGSAWPTHTRAWAGAQRRRGAWWMRQRRIPGWGRSPLGAAPAGAPPSTGRADTQRRRGALRRPHLLTKAVRMRGSGWPMRSSSWAGTTRRSGGTKRPKGAE